jgi:hypothetical protein
MNFLLASMSTLYTIDTIYTIEANDPKFATMLEKLIVCRNR